MSSNPGCRRGPAFAGVLAGVVAAVVMVQSARAQSASAKKIERYTAKTINVAPVSGTTMTFELFDWTTDMVRQQIVDAAGKGEKELLEALKAAPSVGYIWTNESVGYQVRYAYRIGSGAGERIILATDRPLGWTQVKPWEPKTGTATKYQFVIFDLRPAAAAGGNGKTSLGVKFTVDADKKTIELENYTAAPIELTGLKKTAGSNPS